MRRCLVYTKLIKIRIYHVVPGQEKMVMQMGLRLELKLRFWVGLQFKCVHKLFHKPWNIRFGSNHSKKKYIYILRKERTVSVIEFSNTTASGSEYK